MGSYSSLSDLGVEIEDLDKNIFSDEITSMFSMVVIHVGDEPKERDKLLIIL